MSNKSTRVRKLRATSKPSIEKEIYKLNDVEVLTIQNAQLRAENTKLQSDAIMKQCDEIIVTLIRRHIGDQPITDFELDIANSEVRKKAGVPASVMPSEEDEPVSQASGE